MLQDEDLALGVQRGQLKCLTILVERHHSDLIGFVYRLTGGDRQLAEDLVQETFLRMMRAIGRYEYARPFKPWLYMIATNLARDHYKRADTRHMLDVTDDDPQITGQVEPGPEDDLLARAAADEVARAVMGLAAVQREALILRYYQGLSLAEIADVLEVPVGTVKSRLSIGLSRLREKLAEQEA